jgi:hypothetical protein
VYVFTIVLGVVFQFIGCREASAPQFQGPALCVWGINPVGGHHKGHIGQKFVGQTFTLDEDTDKHPDEEARTEQEAQAQPSLSHIGLLPGPGGQTTSAKMRSMRRK